MRFQRPWIDLGAGWLKAAMIMLALAFATVRPGPAAADTAAEIEVSVNVALERFYQEVQGARVFAQNAKGLLILPKVFKAGFIVGGEYGEGALRIGVKRSITTTSPPVPSGCRSAPRKRTSSLPS